MDTFKIIGKTTLLGEVVISGAKNAALPILFANLLLDQPMVVSNVPRLHDVATSLKLLARMGALVSVVGDNEIKIDAALVNQPVADYDLVKTMRASILALGPLLAKYGKAKVALPGGCDIGTRPIDQHLKGMMALGATIEVQCGYVNASAPILKGTRILLDVITVTGTENLMMTAVLAQGQTIIENAACEPEVIDLANFLNACGAKITGIGTKTLVIDGVTKLNGGNYSVIADRIEAGTYLAAGAITRGKITLRKTQPQFMGAVLEKFKEAGASLTVGEDWITLDMQGRLPKAVDIVTVPYPGFPTDMQAQFLAMNCVADGNGSITENIFENRFRHVQELQRLGAKITVHGRTAETIGVERLTGASVIATDLRASASLVLAGLAAEGETCIEQIYHIDRGYEKIEEKLSKVGARITRVKG